MNKGAEEENCIFCLEEMEESKPTTLSCPCRFSAHSRCWSDYEEKKGHRECPICHTIIIPIPQNPQYQIIYIQQPPTSTTHVIIPEQLTCPQKFLRILIRVLFLWIVGTIIWTITKMY